MDEATEEPQKDRPQLAPEQAAAQVLGALDPYWIYVVPPTALTAATGIDDPFDAEEAVVEAHWDGVVSLLGQGGEGYRAVARLSERLNDEVEAAAAAREAAAVRSAAIRDVAAFLEPFRARAPNATLRADLGWPSARPIGLGVESRGYWEASEADENGPDRYTLVLIPPTLDRDFKLPEDVATFLADSTWDEAGLRLKREQQAARAQFHRTPYDSFLSFRRDVVDAVLRTFEVTGASLAFRACFPEGRVFREDDVRIAYVVHEELEAGVSLTSKTKVVLHVRDLLRERGEDVSERSVRDALTRLGAYRETRRDDERDHNKGGQTKAGVPSDLDHLRSRVAEIYRRGEGGVNLSVM